MYHVYIIVLCSALLLLPLIQSSSHHNSESLSSMNPTKSKENNSNTAASITSGSESSSSTNTNADKPAEKSGDDELQKNKDEFCIRLPYKTHTKQTDPNTMRNLLYLCPPESERNSNITKVASKYMYCLFEKKNGTQVENPKTVSCKNEITPNFWNYPENEHSGCGGDRKGTFYTYAYQVCWENSNNLLQKVKNFKKKENKLVRNVRNQFVEIYSICSLKRSNYQAIYVRYTLIVHHVNATPTSKQDEKIALKTSTPLPCNLNLEDIPPLYQSENQKHIREQFEDDFLLIPQLLVPSSHLIPEFAKDSTNNYINVRPQWNTLSETWEYVNKFIEDLARNQSLSIFVYAGTYGIFSINKKELYLRLNEKDTPKISVPLIWWKVLINQENNSNIVIAMQNSPKNQSIQYSEKLCEKSICEVNGWSEIIKDDRIYCCPFNQRMETLLQLNGENITIGGEFSLVKKLDNVSPAGGMSIKQKFKKMLAPIIRKTKSIFTSIRSI